jgi:hypothetical protein
VLLANLLLAYPHQYPPPLLVVTLHSDTAEYLMLAGDVTQVVLMVEVVVKQLHNPLHQMID